jgi:CSLREA domain-containing protein
MSMTRGAALVAASCALLCANASAATFVVDKTADDVGGGACVTATANDCSLRSAIQQANTDAPADNITLGAATYSVITDQEQITNPVTITGTGARSTAIDGGGVAQVLLDVNTSNAVSVSDLTVRGSGPGDFVSAVQVNAGPFTLSRVAVVDNAGIGVNMNGGTALVLSSVIARNTGTGAAGVVNGGSNGILTIRDSTIAQNTALPASAEQPLAFGGGVVNTGAATIINSTIAGNRVAPTASALGGDNVVTISGGGTALGLLRISNSIVADASANGNCGGPIQTAGHNLDSDGTCGFNATTDHPGVDPLLAALADNGGPTDTRALGAGSPAVDAGAGCGATDQRGVARPAGGACDIGAFESPFTAPGPPVVVPPTTPPVTTPAADTTPASLTVSGIKKTVTRKAFNKGLKVKIGANEPIAAEVVLLASPRKVTIASLANLVLATKSLSRAGGTRTVTLKPSPKVKGKRKVKVQLRVVAFDAAGNRSAKTVSFTVK